MKRIMLFYVGMLMIFACQSSQDKKAVADSLSSEKKVVDVPTSLKTLFSPKVPIFRGFSFNSTQADIKSSESASIVEEATSYSKYSLDIDESSFADITYHFTNDSKILEKVQIDIFTSEDKIMSIKKDLEEYFNEIFEPQASIWEGRNNEIAFTVYVKEMKNGLYLVYEPID